MNNALSQNYKQGWLKAQAAKATALGLKVSKGLKKI